ncbi:XrtA/PEP-CTERM system TPR-repeat protein PrsT [Neptunomonas sp.]|uniref:XrtA/PEP-CTERM system TPR-repeat protein PrsT n=1 Tax=Neptunomonas sp. TaxID=1971898 RepID=UPI0025DDBA6D|nr:XrtA/PEP-CTERM system TPR-repeat protein PrsT [Neptunomonas sp.]
MRIVSKAAVVILTFSCMSSSVGSEAASNDVAVYFEDANKLYFQDDFDASIVQLKNALQVDPRHLPSLVLSGEVYLKQGDAKAAEYVLQQALLFGADASLITINLANTYLLLGKYSKIISDLPIEGLPPRIKVDLLGYRAEAYTLLDELGEARESIDVALRVDPSALLPRLASVILLIREGAYEDALKNSQQLIIDWPSDARSWNSHASVVHALGDLKLAIRTYEKALILQASHVDARVAKIGALIDLDRLDEASVDLGFLKRESPYEPRAAYFRGLLLSKMGSDEKARLEFVRCTEVIAVLPKEKVRADPQLLMAAALAHHALKQWESVRTYLEMYLRKVPSDIGAHKLLADVLLGQGEQEQAIKLLNTIRPLAKTDASILTMLAAAYSQTGRDARATKLLEEAVLFGNSLYIETQLAKSQLKSGSVIEGMQALESIYAKEPTQKTAFLLTVMYLKQKIFDKAEVSARRLVSFSSENATYRNLLGVALFSQRKMDDARNQFAAILKDDPAFSAAKINLVKINIAENKLLDARTQMNELLAFVPENTTVMLQVSRLEYVSGNHTEALKWAEKASALESKSLEVVLYLADLYVRLGMYDLAENTVRAGVQSHADNLAVLSLLGQIQGIKNEPKAAQVTFKRMVKIAGFDADALYKIANLQLRINEVADARYSLTKALQGRPGFYPAEVLMTELSIKLGMFVGAEKAALKLQERYPNNPIGFQLLGDVFMEQLQFDKADEQYILGLSIKPVSALVINRFRALKAQNKGDESGDLLEWWLQSYPEDTTVKLAFSEHLLADSQYEKAVDVMQQLLSNFPESALLLNNMAYALYKLNHPDALVYARNAYKKASDIPQVADTLGWLLVESGNAEEGLKYLREASSRQSNAPDIHYHLAVALKSLGRVKEAAIYLDKALLTGVEFEGRGQVIVLKEELQEKLQ